MSKPKPNQAYLDQLRKRYAKASKKQRTVILDEFVATSGYHRKHAIALLRGHRGWHRSATPFHRLRRRIYGDEEKRAVLYLAEVFDQISSKRLRAAMDAELVTLRQQRHLRVSAVCYQHLQTISASSMDRLRRQERKPARRRGGTKPGTLLKRQIPVRTFAEWDDKRPGFEEVDLVQHDGGNPSGRFACTLNVTDVATGWTEMRAVQNKAQGRVFAALKHIRQRMPFELLGIDSDNGAEFINNELWRYTQEQAITFTRGRVGRKNDNPFVEQKNWSVVRRMVGYDRYETPKQVRQLNTLYDLCSVYTNHFLPVSKLVAKRREGSHLQRIFDDPKTPYQRVLDSPDVSPQVKAKLRAIHAALDVVKLKQQIDAAIDAIKPSKVPPLQLR
ncbi:MAG: transposase family protein [Chloroflexi bacterium]|nr:transposase family protein [Chloroflexota bacterium]